jgi:Uma2 family endonuclease
MNMSAQVPEIQNQPLRRITRAEYDQMVGAQVFGDRKRFELVFGRLVDMSPIGPAHHMSVLVLSELLSRALGDRARVHCQQPLAATGDSEPEPDVYVTERVTDWNQHPSRAYFVAEVADTSLRYDRDEKGFLYGVSEVDEYWIVDLVHGVVEVRRDRNDGTWQTIATYRRGETIALLAFPDVTIAVADILPPV